MLFRILVCLLAFTPLVAAGAQLDVRLVTDEPEAVLAVLARKKAAAAGGASVHPHQVSPPAKRKRWDRDTLNFNADLKKVENFFTRVLEGKLKDDEIAKEGFSFFGIQGPWYTVGWRMSALIEETFGKQKLIEVMCDQRLLLPTYNEAAAIYNRKAKEPLAVWSESVVALK